MKFMNRASCSCPPARILRKRIDHTITFQGELIQIKRLPADICQRCGRIWFVGRVLLRLERILRSRPRIGRRVRGRIAEYGSKG